RRGAWRGFGGPGGEGTVRGIRIATDWNVAPPRLLWRKRVGPAWSSVVIVDGRLFTQEQQGEAEVVVCLDAATGQPVWSHEDPVRFADGQAGAGPRATPTFADGRLFALGATGILNCLDAATGKQQWSRNIGADAGASLPLWGFSSSPLVVGGVVVVFAGGESEKTLLAYRAASGEPAWGLPAGKASYASPQLASVGGKDQILFVSDLGLIAADPATGPVLRQYGLHSAGGRPWSLQPTPAGNAPVLIASADLGTALVEISHDGHDWAPAPRWTSRHLKPSFNDFVVHDGFVYGFDGDILCCIEVATGKRRWKEGRYGHGQVLLLADDSLLLVVSESGAAVLLTATPGRHEERGRFQAVKGKTWNHPVIARA